MQKKIIALAIAGLASSAAFAQTNVTIYGVADVFYANLTSDQVGVVKDLKFSGLGDGGLSGSRIGFKVNEDLGGGWSAMGLYELGTLQFNGGGAAGAASVSGAATTRQSYVGLMSKSMGTFQGGRIYTSGHNLQGKYDSEAAAGFSAVNRLSGGLALSIDGGGNNNARLNNSIAWLSPNWNGFTAQVQYAFGENGEATLPGAGSDDARFWGLGLDYSNGPFGIGFAYHDWSDLGGTAAAAATPEREMTEWFVGGSYDFGMAKLYATYQDFDMDNYTGFTAGVANAATAGASQEGDIWSIGVTIPVMKVGTITLNYADLDRSNKAGVAAASVGGDADAWGISYRHNLSKRTTAYIGYVDVDNDNKRAGAGASISVGASVGAPGAGQGSDGFAMGVRHTF